MGEGPAAKKPRTSDRSREEEEDGGKTKEPGAAARRRRTTIAMSDLAIPRTKARLVCRGTPRRARRSTRSSSPERDSRTAFVRNVPFQCTERELERFFEDAGDAGDANEPGPARGLVKARVVMDKATGKPRGFAYVEFTSEKALRAAVMRDGEAFKGRKLSIAVSLPPGRRSRAAARRLRKYKGRTRDLPGARPAGWGSGGHMTPRAARPAVAAGGEDAERPKSNADFRAELLKGFRKSEGV